MEYTEEIKTTYLIELSNKTKIAIDPEELDSVIQGIKSGFPVKVKQGIFNPSFFICIVKDEKRIMEIMEDNHKNRHFIESGKAKPKQLKPLDDVFAKVRNQLEAPK